MYDSCYNKEGVLLIEGLCSQHCRGQNIIKRVYIKMYSFRLCRQRSFLVRNVLSVDKLRAFLYQ